ncbi:hypothetical protein M6D93_09885 [Jatrophihabitans telluris]|uniref:Lipoprotein LpqN n=1 Tax=Jatrophihabitans telluris TaxID=2038343 RepID=A0ABY4QTE0_9ACTN|nr:hypothetical protein [Jatrophihabitans telluris]UQX86624.1 hypothetical protein M6D93_09885 [Jatrophihabitans telluris]
MKRLNCGRGHRLGTVCATALTIAVSAALVAGCGSNAKTAAPTAGISGSTAGSASAAGSSPAGGNTSTAPAAKESNPAGDIPDNQAFVTYRDATARFSVNVPEGWAQTSDAGAALFSDKYNSIRIQTKKMQSAPTSASVSADDLPAIAAASKGYLAGHVTTVDRKAGRAVLATYQANSLPNQVTGKYAVEAVERYAFFRAGQEVILTLSAPVGSDNVDPWRIVTDSLRWL